MSSSVVGRRRSFARLLNPALLISRGPFFPAASPVRPPSNPVRKKGTAGGGRKRKRVRLGFQNHRKGRRNIPVSSKTIILPSLSLFLDCRSRIPDHFRWNSNSNRSSSVDRYAGGFVTRGIPLPFSKRICKLRNIAIESTRIFLLLRLKVKKLAKGIVVVVVTVVRIVARRGSEGDCLKGSGKSRLDARAGFFSKRYYGWIGWKGRFVKRFNSCRTPTALWRGVYYRFSPSNSDAMLVQPRGKRLIRNPSNSFAHVKPHKTRSLRVHLRVQQISIRNFLWKIPILVPRTSY